MSYDPDDTIAAIATAQGGAPRGMVRLSGPQALACLDKCFQAGDCDERLREIGQAKVVAGSVLLGDDDDRRLPCDLYLWPDQRSYTRQPTAELHTVGSPPLLERLLATICNCGARLAEPGEFTLRAFLAGRLDLTQAEAVLGVIDAQSDDQLQTALTQLAGGLSTPLTRLREQLLQLLAELEAGLDFVDEDIEFITADQLREQLSAAAAMVDDVLRQLARREDASDLQRVALVGAPNAGKSSLFNAIVERYAADPSATEALVSAESGTTRDYVTAIVQLDGITCELVDTAGVEFAPRRHSIDNAAQNMTSEQHQQADLLLCCVPPNDESRHSADAREIIVQTKCDLVDTSSARENGEITCSSLEGTGLSELTRLISTKLADATPDAHRGTAIRCSESLREARDSLARALSIVETSVAEELIAAEVRGALHSLGQVVGEVYTDDILDRIFGQFCIGK